LTVEHSGGISGVACLPGGASISPLQTVINHSLIKVFTSVETYDFASQSVRTGPNEHSV